MNVSFNSIVRWFINEFGLKINPFYMVDINTFYFIHNKRYRTYAVMADPDILQYNLTEQEHHKSPLDLLEIALKKVCEVEEGIFLSCEN